MTERDHSAVEGLTVKRTVVRVETLALLAVGLSVAVDTQGKLAAPARRYSDPRVSPDGSRDVTGGQSPVDG